MNLQQLYSFSKKVHNLIMWITIALGIPMLLTGLALHKIVEGEGDFIPLDHELIRWAHGSISNFFALTIVVMMLTGFLMWLLPKILRRQVQSKIL